MALRRFVWVLRTAWLKCYVSVFRPAVCHCLSMCQSETEIALNNASRSGAIANMALAEFTSARIVGDQHVVSVAQHKTAHCYGPAKICLSATHFAWLQSYVSAFHPVVCQKDGGKVFSVGMESRCPVDRYHVRFSPHGTRLETEVTSPAPSFAKLQSRP